MSEVIPPGTGMHGLLSYPEFVQQLMEGFAPPEIAQLMNFSTLKNHSGNYITPLFEEKFEDVVWSVEITWEGLTQEVYLYILLEFQSTVDRTMPIRLMHYVACFYDHLLKNGTTTPSKGYHPFFLSCCTTALSVGRHAKISTTWCTRNHQLFFKSINHTYGITLWMKGAILMKNWGYAQHR